jgi:nucleotide-binding universal stress UspA family protein
MFKRIVVALDGSAGSRTALPLAAALADRDGADLIVAHVQEMVIGKGGGPVNLTEDELQDEIRGQARALEEQGHKVQLQMAHAGLGGPAHAIEQIAADADADLIVVGTRGHSPVAGLLLGSVTQRLLHVAGRPVLVIPTPKS